jgi:hypothetical protein
VSVRFGMVVSQGRPFDIALEDWLRVESLGFSNAWLIDHVAPEPSSGGRSGLRRQPVGAGVRRWEVGPYP